MDAGSVAAPSWPDHNVQFRRPWAMPPPLARRSPALAPTSNRADFEDRSITVNNLGSGAVQRALAANVRRAADLDRQADLLLSLGQHHAAERLSTLAHELREVVR